MVAGHVQIKQDQVYLWLRIQRGQHGVQVAGFEEFDVTQRIPRRLPQGGAEQRVVVGDEQ